MFLFFEKSNGNISPLIIEGYLKYPIFTVLKLSVCLHKDQYVTIWIYMVPILLIGGHMVYSPPSAPQTLCLTGVPTT